MSTEQTPTECGQIQSSEPSSHSPQTDEVLVAHLSSLHQAELLVELHEAELWSRRTLSVLGEAAHQGEACTPELLETHHFFEVYLTYLAKLTLKYQAVGRVLGMMVLRYREKGYTLPPSLAQFATISNSFQKMADPLERLSQGVEVSPESTT